MIIATNVNSVPVDDWTAEWAIIASNVNSVPADDWTVENATLLIMLCCSPIEMIQ